MHTNNLREPKVSTLSPSDLDLGDYLECEVRQPRSVVLRACLVTPESLAYARKLIADKHQGWRKVQKIAPHAQSDKEKSLAG